MNMHLVLPPRPPAPVIETADIKRALEAATDPVEIKEINAKLDAFEQYMHDCGLYSVEDMRPINETRMAERWKLGKALAAVERGERWPKKEERTGRANRTTGFWKWTKETLRLDTTVTVGAQRIGAMPDEEMARAFEQARSEARLLHYGELIVRARPWWFKESRVAKHKSIREAAPRRTVLERPGHFPLIYSSSGDGITRGLAFLRGALMRKSPDKTISTLHLTAGPSGLGTPSERISKPKKLLFR
jgi:hypothetical protein